MRRDLLMRLACRVLAPAALLLSLALPCNALAQQNLNRAGAESKLGQVLNEISQLKERVLLGP